MVELLELKNKNDLKLIETIEQDNYELEKISEEKSRQVNSMTIMDPGLEFFTRFTYCQSLLFNSWIDASNQVTKKLPAVKSDSENSKEISKLYIKVYEETFTNLFKSQEYASNLGKMISASLSLIKNWDVLTRNNNADSDNKDILNKDKR